MGPRAGLGDLEKRKLLTIPVSNSEPSFVQPAASRYTDYAIPADIFIHAIRLISDRGLKAFFTLRLACRSIESAS
jgi:hypothetical protein